jgi:pimeloyl-ACP methyl ester carboxylesterase
MPKDAIARVAGMKSHLDNPRRRACMAAIAALAAIGLTACASVPATGRAVIDGAQTAYTQLGEGTPVIVFQSGLGDGRSTWAGMMQDLRNTHSVFAFDRPGYGDSAPATSLRDPCQIATETRQLLQAAGIKPPYVLVGHSLGGLYQYAFARLYPTEVAGLVLLDPTHPRHWETLQRDAPAVASTLRALRATVFSPTARAEFDHMSDCRDRLEKGHPSPVPTQVLVSTRFSPMESGEFQKALWPLREDWRRLTGAGPLIRVAAGHYIHKDAPGDAAKAIRFAAAGVSRP